MRISDSLLRHTLLKRPGFHPLHPRVNDQGELCKLPRVDLALDAGLGRVECNSEWKSKTRPNRAIAFTPATAARVELWLAGANGRQHVFRTAADVRDFQRENPPQKALENQGVSASLLYREANPAKPPQNTHVFRTAEDVRLRDCYYRIAARFKAAVERSGIARNVTLMTGARDWI